MKPETVNTIVGAALLLWTIGCVLYHSFLVRMENKLLTRFVTRGECERQHGKPFLVQMD